MKTRRIDRDNIREESITFSVSAKEKLDTQTAADKKGVTMSALVRIALKEYLEKEGNI